MVNSNVLVVFVWRVLTLVLQVLPVRVIAGIIAKPASLIGKGILFKHRRMTIINAPTGNGLLSRILTAAIMVNRSAPPVLLCVFPMKVTLVTKVLLERVIAGVIAMPASLHVKEM